MAAARGQHDRLSFAGTREPDATVCSVGTVAGHAVGIDRRVGHAGRGERVERPTLLQPIELPDAEADARRRDQQHHDGADDAGASIARDALRVRQAAPN